MGLKILYHHRTQGKGVERVHILGFANACIKNGHEVEILSPPGISPLDDFCEKTKTGSINIWKTVSQRMPEFLFEIFELLYNFWAFVALRKKTRCQKYDLIYERYAFLGFAGLMTAIWHRIPFLLEVNFTFETPLVRRRSRSIRFLDRLIEKLVFKKANGLIAVSSYLRNQLIENGISSERIIVVPNAADPAKFHPADADSALVNDLNIEEKKTIGFVGFFYKWHGIDLLLDAFNLIVKYRDDVACVLIGEGPMLSILKERVISDKFEKQVLFTGKVPHAEINRYISLFDIAVIPHSNVYGSPMKLFEYMAMGKAVVAPRLEPLQDVIEEKENGLLFEPENLEDLAQKILQLLLDDNLRDKIGKNARESIIKEHNWEKRADKILKYYQSINKE